MNKLEKMEQEAFDNNVNIYSYYLGGENLKGLYFNGNIAINTSVNKTDEKTCTIAEEMGHHHTTVGDILDMTKSWNRKQERQARLWAYNKLIGLTGLIQAYEHGCQNLYETADFLEVTEEVLSDAIECYRDKYGVGVIVDNYYVMFIPNLQVLKMF